MIIKSKEINLKELESILLNEFLSDTRINTVNFIYTEKHCMNFGDKGKKQGKKIALTIVKEKDTCLKLYKKNQKTGFLLEEEDLIDLIKIESK